MPAISSVSSVPFSPRVSGVETPAQVDAERSAAPWSPERPTLTPPHQMRADLRFLKTTGHTRMLGEGLLETMSTRMSALQDKITDISAQNMQKLREAAERAKASDFWSMLKKIATCIVSAMSVVFGIALFASGGSALMGGAMIASGILSLANFAMVELGAWDWIAGQIARDNEDLKQKLRMALPLAVGVLAAGIGLAGSVHMIASGGVQFIDKAVLVAKTAVDLIDATTTLGQGASDAQRTWTEAALKLIDADLTIAQEQFGSLLDGVKNSLNDFKQMQSTVKNTVNKISNINIQVSRS